MQTPPRRWLPPAPASAVALTPINLSKELKQVLNERNLLTAKTRKQVCSMLDSASPLQLSEMDKRRTFRRQAIQEVLESEKAYLKQLETLMKFFIIPLKERGIIDDAKHTTLFGQIEMIYNLNGELLKELENDLDNVANAFLKLAPFFKLYSVYAFDYKNALFILQDLISKNPIFRRFLQDTETRPEVQTKLNALMITPIQRVPRYRLLLEQVLLYTSPADNDFKALKESVKQIETTVSHINSVIEDQEVTQTLLNLQNSLVNRTPNIVKPSRKVIKEGMLDKVTSTGIQIKRYCVLMSDIFMYCHMVKDRPQNTVVENSLKCCCIFPLKKCKVYDIFPGHLKISCQGDGIILCTNDLRLGQSWVTALKEAIEMHIECRKTLRKESSKRTPMRRKDVKHFDSDLVFSPNKRKCDYETVFRCKSQSESDEESSSFCFNLKNKIRKRKHDETNLNVTTQRETCNESDKKNSQNLTKTIVQQSNKKSAPNSTNLLEEDHDPTYGFSTRFSNSNSYCRTFRVDSEAEVTTPIKDVLYPLRTSGRSSKSGAESEGSWMNKREAESGHTDEFERAVKRKRVKFEDTSPMEGLLLNPISTNSSRPEAFSFNESNNSGPGPSLRQRVMDFFSRLF